MFDESKVNEKIENMTSEERLKVHKTQILNNLNPHTQLSQKKHVGHGKGTFVERDLFESDAFIALKGVAPQMLIFLLGKRKFSKPSGKSKARICENEDNLTFSYLELKALGITQPRATRGFDELLAKGFITIKHQGGGYQKDMSVYSLSNQYLLWKKGSVFSKRPQGCKKGFQGGQKAKTTYAHVAHPRKRNRNL